MSWQTQFKMLQVYWSIRDVYRLCWRGIQGRGWRAPLHFNDLDFLFKQMIKQATSAP
jgi:hypothetical protein